MALFRKWTAEERAALPAEDYGDPARKLFPIADQDDIDSAARLLGRAQNPERVKARIIAIAKRKGLRIPDAWQASMSGGAHATFALDTAGRRVEDGWAIYPNALLFRAGDYADKSFSLTPEEQWAAVETFQPVWGNIEHTDFMRGKALQVRRLHLDAADSTILRGEVAVPLWLDEELSPHEKGLSCEWARDGDKPLLGVALTTTPRVPDAALMAAFAGKRHSSGDQQDMQSIHDISARQGATCDPANTPATGPAAPLFTRGRRMKLFDWMKQQAQEQGVTIEDDPAAFAAPQPDPRVADLETKLRAQETAMAEQQAAMARFKAERIEQDAANDAEKLILAGKALPAEKEAIIAAFRQAATDDAAHGSVTFSAADGTQSATSRVQTLRAAYDARPAHIMAREMIPTPEGATALMSQMTTPKAGEEKAWSPDELRAKFAQWGLSGGPADPVL